MKIDPVTGKTYLKDWQRDLGRIHYAGFSYLYRDRGLGHRGAYLAGGRDEGGWPPVEMANLEEALGVLYRIIIQES
jgi:hypothetical protein